MQVTNLFELDDELLAVVFEHADGLAFTVLPFVCHQFFTVERERRKTLPRRELRKPTYAAQRDYVAVLIKTRFFHMVLWAHSVSYEMPTAFCYRIAEVNGLELLQWARSKGYPWTYKVTGVAAERNYFPLLKWAIEND